MNQQTKFKQTEIGLIPEDWQFKELKAVTLLITDGKHGDCRNQENSGYFFLSAKDVIDGNLDYSSAREIKKEDFLETHRRTNLQPEDILISNSGTIGRLAIAKENDKTRRTTFQKSVAVIKPNKKIIAPYFLYYWFLAKIKYLKHLAGGTTQQNLLLGDLRKFIIVIPKENEQEAILKILLDLDKRIELLQKQNKTLEAIGQAIFKHWFVDFEFPNEEGKPYKSSGGEMVDSELGDIPKDWKVNQLKDFGDIICGKTPPKSNKEYFEGDIPFIKIPDMHNQLFVINTEDSLTKEGKKYQENKTIPEKSICVSCIATVGLVSLTSKESQTNQQINSIIPKNSYSTYYLHYMFKSMYQLLQDYGSGGSATLNINTKTFSKIKILSPKNEVMKEFHKKVNSIFDKILNNLNENNNLSKIRDLLLPKLMSGKIRVPVEVE